MSEQQPGLAQSCAAARCGGRRDHVAVGHICLARPDRGPDIVVLITEVHEEHVEAMLCGHAHHIATDTDSVLEPRVTGYLGRLLVHGDVCGRIMKRRLLDALGRVEPTVVERVVLRGRGLDFDSSDLGRGRAMAGEADPRWDWKLDKFRQMRTVRARASELGWQIYRLRDAGPREA